MNTQSKKQGFSLIELMVAMVAFSVLTLVVGTLIVYSWMGWRDHTESVNMQRDAMIAMRIMAKEIRSSNISEVSGNEDSIDFTAISVRTTSRVFAKSEIASSSGVVLDSWTEPVIGSNYVTVAFSLRNSRGADRNDYLMSIYPRN